MTPPVQYGGDLKSHHSGVPAKGGQGSVVDLPAVGRAAPKMYFVYILQSLKDKKFYTGITNNLERRLKEHNKGKKSTPSTAYRGPFKLVYFEKFNSRQVARKREKFLKSGTGREFRNRLTSQYSAVAQW